MDAIAIIAQDRPPLVAPAPDVIPAAGPLEMQWPRPDLSFYAPSTACDNSIS
jgi:hypothetical protein